MNKLNRRDFIKISSAFIGGATLFSVPSFVRSSLNKTKPNVIVFIFDAMSALHLSIYGYAKHNTPNFERFARRATVYHANYSSANFTVPGTATLLTGLYPWSHRAFNLGGLVVRNRADTNIFNLIGKDYFRVGYSQNFRSNNFLHQFRSGIDLYLPPAAFASSLIRVLFSADETPDSLGLYFAFDEFLARAHPVYNPIPGSIALGTMDMLAADARAKKMAPTDEYPYGPPNDNYYYFFDNKAVFSGITEMIVKLKDTPPFLGYFHFYAPHSPYTPHKDFVGIFQETEFLKKPRHPISYSHHTNKVIRQQRDQYDEYIANVDDEFGRLINTLEENGILDNSYIVIASDHGELFERGEIGHGTALLYEGVVRTPLIISAPGQTDRVDIHAPTSNADLMPTLLSLTGNEVPPDLDGRILPGLGGSEDFKRPIFLLEAKENSSFAPLTKATVALRKGPYKLIYYAGYPRYNQKFELFNIQEDPAELTNTYTKNSPVASSMRDELLSALDVANKPFVSR